MTLFRMWDCGTGQAIGSPLLGHTDEVNSVCTDGQMIISGSDDGTIRIWSCDTRQLIGTPIDAGKIVSLLLFPRMVALLQEWATMYVSLILRLDSKLPLMKGHTVVCTVAFSPMAVESPRGAGQHNSYLGCSKPENRCTDSTDIQAMYALSPFLPMANGSLLGVTIRQYACGIPKTGQPVGLPLTGHTAM
jgi:WD40 repeat protein